MPGAAQAVAPGVARQARAGPAPGLVRRAGALRQVPVEQVPVERVPVEQVPVERVPVEQVLGEPAPGERVRQRPALAGRARGRPAPAASPEQAGAALVLLRRVRQALGGLRAS
jgi:hypothetical protein